GLDVSIELRRRPGRRRIGRGRRLRQREARSRGAEQDCERNGPTPGYSAKQGVWRSHSAGQSTPTAALSTFATLCLRSQRAPNAARIPAERATHHGWQCEHDDKRERRLAVKGL